MGAGHMGAHTTDAGHMGARPRGAQTMSGTPMGAHTTDPRHTAAGRTGTQSTDAGRTGTQPMSSQPAASQAMGTHPMGGQPAASQPLGAQPTANQPMGSHPTGTHPAEVSPAPGPAGHQQGAGRARRKARAEDASAGAPAPGAPAAEHAEHTPAQPHPAERPEWAARAVAAPGGPGPVPPQDPAAPEPGRPGWGSGTPSAPAAQPAAGPSAQPGPVSPTRQPLPAETPPGGIPAVGGDTQGRAFSVRTLGQGAPFGRTQPPAQPQGQTQTQAPAPATGQTPAQPGTQAAAPLGSGRRRKLGTPTPPKGVERPAEPAARPHPVLPSPPSEGQGRAYAIGAPDEGAEGPEPLDGPGGAVEVAHRPQPQPIDDELPPEPLDNPRRLLVWPAPDVSTQQALSERGYRPVVVHSREEVDAQIAAFPAALFVDPLTGPITRTALQSLRQAAVAAEVPVLVTAGLGQATREAAYGADPAVLLKALAPRDSEQHPPRVLLIEEHEEIALALTATLERRGMQVARAATDSEAVTLAGQMRPNLVVMDLMQVRRRRAGIVDWLRANGQLNHTPLVVYTSAAIDQAELPKLASGETVLFLAERSTSGEVQGRIVDLLAKIGTN